MYTYVIIDDEELIRKGTRKKIEPLADTVTCIGEAENGKEAIRLVAELSPDFVIMDMQMPIMDGMELLPYLAEQYPNMPLIVISGYRDFDYIKQAFSSNAVEYLLKPFSKEMIGKCITDAISRLEHHSVLQNQITATENEKEHACYDYDVQLLNNLILGYHVSDTTLTSKRLNFINDTHNLMLLTLHFDQSQPEGDIQEWLEEHGFGDLALYLSGSDHRHLGFIILFLPRHGSIRNEHLADQILSDFLPFMLETNIIVTAGISKTHNNLSDLSSAYGETSQALNQQFIMKPSSARYFYKEDASPKPLVWDKEDEFLFRMEAGMEEETAALTKALFAYYATNPSCTLTDVKYHCYQLSEKCRQILNIYFKNAGSPTSSGSMQNVVNHLFTLAELEAYFLQFFTNLSGILKPDSVYSGSDTIENIQTYIKRNYQKDITQEFISSLFFLNRSYLSTLFRERTGEKFVDYLNGVRIEKAKELLRTSEKKMYQIARGVGYDNVKYFFRVFKKKTGVTPEQYRNSEGNY